MNSNLFYRSADLQARATGDRKISLSFSSEQPVDRWFGKEILVHGPDNVDLTRLQAVGSLIYGHDPGKIENILGRINRAWIEDRKGRAEITMDKDGPGKLALNKINSGSLRGVSFGYMIDQARQLEEGEIWTDPDTGRDYKGPALIATRWTPYEISLTPIPADPSVGIGREATRSLEGIHIVSTQRKETLTMTKEEIRAMILDAVSTKVAANVRETTDEIRGLLDQAGLFGAKARKMVEDELARKTPILEIRRHLLDMAGCVSPASDDPQRHGNVIRSFKQITDDDFFAGLCNPAQHVFDAPRSAPRSTIREVGRLRSFRDVTDEDFFAGLSNPSR